VTTVLFLHLSKEAVITCKQKKCQRQNEKKNRKTKNRELRTRQVFPHASKHGQSKGKQGPLRQPLRIWCSQTSWDTGTLRKCSLLMGMQSHLGSTGFLHTSHFLSLGNPQRHRQSKSLMVPGQEPELELETAKAAGLEKGVGLAQVLALEMAWDHQMPMPRTL